VIQLADHVCVDRAARLECTVEVDLADLAAQRRLRELNDREAVVGDAVRSAAGIQHLQVQHAVDAHLDVVPGDADLFGDIERFLLERVPVRDALGERYQDVKARLDRAAESTERFDDECTLLRHHDCSLHQHDEDEHDDGQGDVHAGTHSATLLSDGTDMQGEPIDVRNDGFLACIDRLLVDVARSPRRAAVFGAAALAGLEAHWNHDAVTERQPLVDVAGALAHQLVDAIAERDHGDESQDREGDPLVPGGHGGLGEVEESDQRCRDTEENQIELRVDDE
jgi:hypothetical protein